MDANKTLRIFVSLSFFLFLLPFLRFCSKSYEINSNSSKYHKLCEDRTFNQISEDTLKIGSDKEDSNKKNEASVDKCIEEHVKKDIQKITFFSEMSEDIGNFKSWFKWNASLNEGVAVSFYEICYITSTDLFKFNINSFIVLLFIFILSISIWILTFLQKFKWTLILGVSNLILLVIFSLLVLFEIDDWDISVFRIGFYLLFINKILIVFFAWKSLKKNTSSTNSD